MSAALQELTPTAEEWDALVARAPGATFYHTRAWAEVLQHTFGYQAQPRLFAFDDGTTVLLPAVKVGRSAWWRDMRAVPSGYGAPISSRPLTETQHRPLWRAITKPCRTRSVLSVRFGPRTDGAWPDLGHSRGVRGRQRTDFTHAIDLRGGFEPLWLKFGQSVRRYHGRGSRDGLNVRYSSSAADVDRFYAAYDYNTRAWPAHERKPLALFRNLATLAPGAARIWLVEDAAGATLAGAIAVEFGDSVHFWAGARDARLDRQHANLLLFPEIIRDACERGFAWFDFGSSQGLSHVQSFKEQFRPQQFDYPVWTFEGPLAGTLRRLRRAA